MDLLRMMLAMTPLERLRYLEDFLRGVEVLKEARRVAEGGDAIESEVER